MIWFLLKTLAKKSNKNTKRVGFLVFYILSLCSMGTLFPLTLFLYLIPESWLKLFKQTDCSLLFFFDFISVVFLFWLEHFIY